MIDAAVAKALGIPADSLESVRQMFSGEPRMQPRERPGKGGRPEEPDDGQELLALFD